MKSYRFAWFLPGILIALIAVPAFGATTVEVVQYGLHCEADCTGRFLVQVGKPVFLTERIALGEIIGLLSQGTMWVHDGDHWVVMDHRLPTPIDFRLSANIAELISRLVTREQRTKEDLPVPIRFLAPEILGNVEGFIAFYEGGAFRIYPQDDSEAAAQRLASALKAVVSIEFNRPPVWGIGEMWHFVAYLPDSPDWKFYDLTWKVVDSHMISSFETEGGHDQLNFYTDLLEWSGVDGAAYDVMNHGAKYYTPLVRHVPPIPFYSWPLMPGKTWERCTENTVPPGGKHCNSFKVLRIENVTVPAGTYLAAVIEHRMDDKLYGRRWYAPSVKNMVKNEQFNYYSGKLRLTLVLDRTNVGETDAN